VIGVHGHELKHLPLDADELGQVGHAYFAGLLLECKGSGPLFLMAHDTIANPFSQAIDVNVSQTARTVAG
jgi:hypothetical protein